MPAPLRAAALALLASAAAASAVTPVEKVIALLEDLKTQVQSEGKDEAKSYNDFACFCKDMTQGKSDSITSGRDTIETLSAGIQEKTASREEKITELKQRQVDQEGFKQDLETTTLRCAKEEAEYAATAADLSKTISSLEPAIQAMQGQPSSAPAPAPGAPVGGASLALMGLLAQPNLKAVSSLLQVGSGLDPSDPEYKYHSQGIVDTLGKLLTDFRAKKSELDAEWGKTKDTCDGTKLSLNDKITENESAMGILSSDIDTLKGGIANARGDLVNAESVLKDDQLYVKDLTEQCGTRATDWDQRSQLRADELEALSGALAIMKENVSSLDADANERALFLERSTSGVVKAKSASAAAHLGGDERAGFVGISRHAGGLSFLQGAAAKGQGRGLRGAHAAALSARARQDQVVALLSQEGRRLGSSALASLAMHVAADPFAKVKQLIQRLVEELLEESTEEATKKGFCGTQLGKAEKDRDYSLADAKNLDAELKLLEIKQDELAGEISVLSGAIGELEEDLATATAIRKEGSAENLETIRKGTEGVASLRQAISMLKLFYARAGRAEVLLQTSPVDESTGGAGFEGAYHGKQEASSGIIGMLEVIKSDFERTVKTTDAAEKQAHASFVEFDRASKADISGKQRKETLDEEDLETTKNNMAQGMADLQTAQGILDAALRTIEDLKPACIDTGMSYDERVAKRDEETAALKKALCILDTEGVETGCQL